MSVKKKIIISIFSFCFVCLSVTGALIYFNPNESCGCLPEYEAEWYYAFETVQTVLERSALAGNLQYDASRLQFTNETMEEFENELKSSYGDIDPHRIWFKYKDDKITELLYVTVRTKEYAGIFSVKETIYILVPESGGSREIFTSRPAGW